MTINKKYIDLLRGSTERGAYGAFLLKGKNEITLNLGTYKTCNIHFKLPTLPTKNWISQYARTSSIVKHDACKVVQAEGSVDIGLWF